MISVRSVLSCCDVTCERKIESVKRATKVQTNLIKVGLGILPVVLEYGRQHYGRLMKVRESFFCLWTICAFVSLTRIDVRSYVV
jgi:hypothetical protein